MSYSYIDSDSLFEQFRPQISSSSILFLDTEFIRVSTYFPKLGLLQLHLNDVDYLIDPVTINQKKSVWDSLYSDEKLFVFIHAKKILMSCRLVPVGYLIKYSIRRLPLLLSGMAHRSATLH